MAIEKRRLVELGMPTELAKEVAAKIPNKPTGVATVATADATDLATAITLVNALKSRLNSLITALKT